MSDVPDPGNEPQPDPADDVTHGGDAAPDSGAQRWNDASVERSSVARSAKWSLIGLVSKQLARIGFSVVLARILGPTNFGIVGQATIYLALSMVFLDIGLASALIQKKRIDDAMIGTATLMNLGAVAVLILLTQLLAGMWADLLGTPELAPVLRVLSLDFLLIGFAVVPTALLTRRLDFRKLAMAEIAGTFIGGAAGVASAMLGAQYWALVVQTLTMDLVVVIIVVAACGRPIMSWSRSAFRSIVGFSSRVLGAEVLRFLSHNADNTLIALRLGPAALANYALSFRVLLLPVQILSQTANRLVFPIFSRLNDRPDRQAAYFLQVTASLALVVTPLMLVILMSASRAVPIVFGPDWEGAIRPMQILSVVSIISAVMGTSGGVMLAKGRADWAFRWSVVTTFVLIGGFVVGLNWGVDGVAWAYLLLGTPLAAIEVGFVRKLIPYTVRDYAQAVMPAVVGGAALCAVWWGVATLTSLALDDMGMVVVSSAVSLGVFFLVIRIGWPGVLRDQIEFVRLMVRRSI